jgi:methionine-rich copper-binding protein CopC
MKPVLALIIAAALWLPAVAAAHAPLQSSIPIEGSVGPAPRAFTLTFAHPARLTSLQVKDADGRMIPVRGISKALAASHEISAPKLAPGRYELLFRALAEDGHVMSGVVVFTVTASVAEAGTATKR